MFTLTLLGLILLLILPVVQQNQRERLYVLVTEHVEPARLQISRSLAAAYEARSYVFSHYLLLDLTPHPSAKNPLEYFQSRIASWRHRIEDEPQIRYCGEAALRAWRTGMSKIGRWLESYALASIRSGEPPDDKQADMLFEGGIAALRAAAREADAAQAHFRELEYARSKAQTLLMTPLALICILLSCFAWWNMRRLDDLSARERRTAGRLQVAINEIHHRVRNNLQVLSGLIEMQMQDTGTRRQTLENTARHLRALATVHGCITSDFDPDTVPTDRLLRQLAARLAPPAQMEVEPDSPSFLLSLSQAEAVALIVSELLTGYSRTGAFHMRVRLNNNESMAELLIEEDRSGDQTDSALACGMRPETGLIDILVRHDLRGNVVYDGDPRSLLKVRFPLKNAA
jgi:two-component sensor histidine kinase